MVVLAKTHEGLNIIDSTPLSGPGVKKLHDAIENTGVNTDSYLKIPLKLIGEITGGSIIDGIVIYLYIKRRRDLSAESSNDAKKDNAATNQSTEQPNHSQDSITALSSSKVLNFFRTI